MTTPESEAQIKYRNMILQVLLMIVTCGFYSFYWFYQVTRELKDDTRNEDASPGLWTVLLFIPFGQPSTRSTSCHRSTRSGRRTISTSG